MKIATLNLRNIADRWPERFHLIVKQILQERPDILAFQEVALSICQADVIADAVNQQLKEQHYRSLTVRGWGPESTLGEAILSRYEPLEYRETRLPKGGRVAQMLHVSGNTKTYRIVNTHLHHLPKDDEYVRLRQVKFLLQWISEMRVNDSAWIVAGDFNATPESKTIQQVLKEFASAHLSFHGAEPEYTFPTPLVQDQGDWNTPRTIDYVFFSPTTVAVQDVYLAFAQAASDDPTLFASDHFGLVAVIS